MNRPRTRLFEVIQFVKKIDKPYLHEKYRQLKNIKKEDVFRFVKRNRKYIKYAIITGIAIMILIPIFTYIYFVRDLSSKERILTKKNHGVVLLDRNDVPFFTLFDASTKNPITLSDLPEYTGKAFISIEDKDFYSHPGFSISGIGRAIRENLLSQSSVQGGSTISQQLIKNAILSPDKQLLRKYQELVLALELERRYSKDDILELYINTNYYGEGAVGIQDAAQRYFSKDAKDLTIAESALFAGIIRAPSFYSPLTGDLDAALERKDLILELMHKQKYITEEELEEAKAEEIELDPTEQEINEQGVHFALMIQDLLIEEFGEQDVAQSGFVVKTTMDLTLQTAAQDAVEAQVNRLKSSKVSNGAAVAIDPKTGQVLALVGSYDWSDTETGRINMAVRPRQPGSSFKPIIYGKAFEEKLITPSTQLDDEAVSFGSYKPRNYDNKFRGKVLARFALANSLNIPAVHVMNMVGVEDGIRAARELGITTLSDDTDYGLPLVLGAAEVPLVEMTNAFATYANQGEWNSYSLYTQVLDKNGKKILENKTESKRALPASVAFLISSILSDNKIRADVFGTALNISRLAAVKTGTTEDYRDALTIGYTPQIAVGVWIGNNDNSPMTSVAGSLGAAPIWRQIMEGYLRGKPTETFIQPAGVVSEEVCFEDGLRVEFATSSAYTEFFLRGTAPTKLCGIPTPTPTSTPSPTPNEDKNNKDDEKKDNKNKPTNTPTPTQSPSPTPTPAISVTITIAPTPTIEIPTVVPNDE